MNIRCEHCKGAGVIQVAGPKVVFQEGVCWGPYALSSRRIALGMVTLKEIHHPLRAQWAHVWTPVESGPSIDFFIGYESGMVVVDPCQECQNTGEFAPGSSNPPDLA